MIRTVTFDRNQKLTKEQIQQIAEAACGVCPLFSGRKVYFFLSLFYLQKLYLQACCLLLNTYLYSLLLFTQDFALTAKSVRK